MADMSNLGASRYLTPTIQIKKGQSTMPNMAGCRCSEPLKDPLSDRCSLAQLSREIPNLVPLLAGTSGRSSVQRLVSSLKCFRAITPYTDSHLGKLLHQGARCPARKRCGRNLWPQPRGPQVHQSLYQKLAVLSEWIGAVRRRRAKRFGRQPCTVPRETHRSLSSFGVHLSVLTRQALPPGLRIGWHPSPSSRPGSISVSACRGAILSRAC